MKRTLNHRAIQAFADTWPCSGLRGCTRVVFEYDSDGDLVDVQTWPKGFDFDGPALAALSHDCQDDKAYRSLKAA